MGESVALLLDHALDGTMKEFMTCWLIGAVLSTLFSVYNALIDAPFPRRVPPFIAAGVLMVIMTALVTIIRFIPTLL